MSLTYGRAFFDFNPNSFFLISFSVLEEVIFASHLSDNVIYFVDHSSLIKVFRWQYDVFQVVIESKFP